VSEIQEISMDTWQRIRNNSLPGASACFFDEGGSCYTRLVFFRERYGQVVLYVEDVVQLARQDSIVHQDLIDVDKNPELFDLYDWNEEILVFDEVNKFLNGIHVAGSVSNFGELPPTTTISTHDS
jgi:hypothetical protein